MLYLYTLIQFDIPSYLVLKLYNEEDSKDLETEVLDAPEEKIAQSLIPYNRDDSRARYLGLRASGFTIREALRLISKAKSTLSFWRLDPEFVDLESRLPEFRRELALEYSNLEFLRNYRLVLEKDYQVLQKSIHPDKDAEGKLVPMASQDHAYLIRMRSHYTPQQLQIMETLIGAQTGGQEFNFTDFVITASKMEERIRVEAKHGVTNAVPKVPSPDSEGV